MYPVKKQIAQINAEQRNLLFLNRATRNIFGVVKIGDGLNVVDGVVSVDAENVATIKTIAKNGTNLVPDINKRVNIELTKADVGLNNVNNTSDLDKPISTATNAALLRLETTMSANKAALDAEIERLEDAIEGKEHAVAFTNYSEVVDEFNYAATNKYKVGQSVFVQDTLVPDLWVYSIENTHVDFAYVGDEDIIETLETTGTVQFGYYKLAMMETKSVDVELTANKLISVLGDSSSVVASISNDKVILELDGSITSKLAKSLVTPMSAPTATQLVAVDDGNSQTMIDIGDGLSLEDGTLKAIGGGGGDFVETDPTVPAWAKNATKPSYTASEVGAVARTNGYATNLQVDTNFHLAGSIGTSTQQGYLLTCDTLGKVTKLLPTSLASSFKLEKNTNKVTSLTNESTDTQYPSAKAVYDYVQSATQNVIQGLGTVFDLKGTKATIQDLPSTDNEIGDVWYVVSEQVGYIWLNDGTTDRWEQFGSPIDLSGYVQYVDIINNLTSTATNKVLSAYQGKVLNDLIADIRADLTTAQGNITSLNNDKANASALDSRLALDGSNTMTGKLNLKAYGPNEGNIGPNGIGWDTTSLPQDTAPQFICTIDGFTNGGRQKWASLADLKTALGVASYSLDGTTLTITT